MINACGNLPQVSFVSVRFPWRVRPGIAVRRECHHHALGFSSPARRFFAVARLAPLDGTVAGGGIDLHSSVPSAGLAGTRDGFRVPFPRTLGAVHFVVLHGTGRGFRSQCRAKEGRSSLTPGPGRIVGRPSIGPRLPKRRRSERRWLSAGRAGNRSYGAAGSTL